MRKGPQNPEDRAKGPSCSPLRPGWKEERGLFPDTGSSHFHTIQTLALGDAGLGQSPEMKLEEDYFFFFRVDVPWLQAAIASYKVSRVAINNICHGGLARSLVFLLPPRPSPHPHHHQREEDWAEEEMKSTEIKGEIRFHMPRGQLTHC